MSGNADEQHDGDSGPFPIPSILGQDDGEPKGGFPGAPHAKRVVETIEGPGGVLELLELLKGCVNELPEKAHASSKSEMDRCELEETRLDAHQTLVKLENLIEEIKVGIDMAATP